VTDESLAEIARQILDSNRYMTLATADESGQPWASPVYYAAEGYRELVWVSSPDATHSRNIAVRPQVSIVVFDSGVEIGTGQAVYMSALAEQLAPGELDRGVEIFSRVSVRHGASEWPRERVEPPAPNRMYRATVSHHWVLEPDASPDRRTPVAL
jgi:nitroimidazol reductase NimA-like FMN-containing flavoprotein (pyridoxamine 5'-phosphate oxidase superfamily)